MGAQVSSSSCSYRACCTGGCLHGVARRHSALAMSWKHTFKPHRVAANAGNVEDNFIYHREQVSFPKAMQKQMPGAPRQAAVARSRFSLGRLAKKVLPDNPITVFGLMLPVIGIAVIATFAKNAQNNSKQAEELRAAEQRRYDSQSGHV